MTEQEKNADDKAEALELFKAWICMTGLTDVKEQRRIVEGLHRKYSVISAALSQQCQPSNTPPLDLLERANTFPPSINPRLGYGPIVDSIVEWYTKNHMTIRALLDAAILQKPVDAWQPIETAPKDGRKVDLFIAADYNHRLTDCQYFKYGIDGEGWYRNYGENKVNPVIITHWMPLPPAPSQHPDKER